MEKISLETTTAIVSVQTPFSTSSFILYSLPSPLPYPSLTLSPTLSHVLLFPSCPLSSPLPTLSFLVPYPLPYLNLLSLFPFPLTSPIPILSFPVLIPYSLPPQSSHTLSLHPTLSITYSFFSCPIPSPLPYSSLFHTFFTTFFQKFHLMKEQFVKNSSDFRGRI